MAEFVQPRASLMVVLRFSVPGRGHDLLAALQDIPSSPGTLRGDIASSPSTVIGDARTPPNSPRGNEPSSPAMFRGGQSPDTTNAHIDHYVAEFAADQVCSKL